jgi:hypothetical protein
LGREKWYISLSDARYRIAGCRQGDSDVGAGTEKKEIDVAKSNGVGTNTVREEKGWCALYSTVEALLTHTPREQLQAMGYEGVWSLRMLLKIDQYMFGVP